MYKLPFIIIMLVMMIFQFVPMQFLLYQHYGNINIKQALNLSARVIGVSVEKSRDNLTRIAGSRGNEGSAEIEIDKEALLKSFYETLGMNLLAEETFKETEKNLILKAVVHHDRFYVAGRDDRWSPPYYYTFREDGETVYLSAESTAVTCYEDSGEKIDGRSIVDYGMSESQKNDIIINKINSIVSQGTSEKPLRQNGLKIQIRNPANNEGRYRTDMGYFNALGGVTFFVVYADNTGIIINNKDMKYRKYSVVGFTIE